MQQKKFLCATSKSSPRSKLHSEKVFEFNHAENLTECWCNDVFLLRCNLKWATLKAPSFKSMSSFSSFNTKRRKNKQNIEASVATECRVGNAGRIQRCPETFMAASRRSVTEKMKQKEKQRERVEALGKRKRGSACLTCSLLICRYFLWWGMMAVWGQLFCLPVLISPILVSALTTAAAVVVVVLAVVSCFVFLFGSLFLEVTSLW